MSFVLLLLTLLVFVGLELVKSRRNATHSTETRNRPQIPTFAVTERFYHPGHAWLAVESDERVVIGADDFAQKVVRRLTSIKLPHLGAHLEQGEVFATLEHGGKGLPQVAPVSGLIVEVNEALSRKPELVNYSPFEKGWIAKLTPDKLTFDKRNLLGGLVAEQWQQAVRSRMIEWFAPPAYPVLQDGGTIIDGVSDLITEDEWQRFVLEFFPVAATNNTITN